MRQGMIQLWADLEQVCEDMGLTLQVRKVKSTGRDLFDASGLVSFKSRGPQVIRSNSTYYRESRKIICHFQPDFTPAYRAGVLAHELGHHISQIIYGNRYNPRNENARNKEEIRASLHAYELLYSLTKGRVPLGCIDMLNISLASYVGKAEQL